MIDPRDAHKLDQETGAMHQLAVKLAAYYRSLKSEGFSAAEAFRLVRDYQRSLWASVFPRKD